MFLFSFPPGVYVGTLNLIASIPGPSILTFYVFFTPTRIGLKPVASAPVRMPSSCVYVFTALQEMVEYPMGSIRNSHSVCRQLISHFT